MNVSIRPLRENDALVSWKWRQDPDIFGPTVGGWYKNASLEKEMEWIRNVLTREDEMRFAILAEGLYVGNVYLTSISPDSAEMGIFIGNKAYWHKGVGWNARLLAVKYAFEILKVKKVVSRIKSSNTKALSIAMGQGSVPLRREGNLVYLELSAEDFYSENNNSADKRF